MDIVLVGTLTRAGPERRKKKPEYGGKASWSNSIPQISTPRKPILLPSYQPPPPPPQNLPNSQLPPALKNPFDPRPPPPRLHLIDGIPIIANPKNQRIRIADRPDQKLVISRADKRAQVSEIGREGGVPGVEGIHAFSENVRARARGADAAGGGPEVLARGIRAPGAREFAAEVGREFRGKALDAADVVHWEHLGRAAGAKRDGWGIAGVFLVE